MIFQKSEVMDTMNRFFNIDKITKKSMIRARSVCDFNQVLKI